MYYYKVYYQNGDCSYLASKKAIRNPKQICKTCSKVQFKSFFWYIKEWLLNFKLYKTKKRRNIK